MSKLEKCQNTIGGYMKSCIPKNLFVLEMANNHMGDLKHGLQIIREFKEVTNHFSNFNFSIKLQHRCDSFIHPAHIDRKDHKLIKRFSETKLKRDEFVALTKGIAEAGFITMCTPWDEPSVNLMEVLDFDIFKIASCSFQDWPLLERIVKVNKPIIASTAGATLDEIDNFVTFFSRRNKDFALMHCVGEYPCLRENLELNQIGFLKNRYPGVPIGFSTHEDPLNFDSIKIAIAQGATIFEKHVGVPTSKYELNSYSATPEQAALWLNSAQDAFSMCGISKRRKGFKTKEINDLRILHRGVYANRDILKGEKIAECDIFCAMPNIDGQLVAQQLSKYTEFYAEADIAKDAPVMTKQLKIKKTHDKVFSIVNELKALIKKSKVVLPSPVEVEISHHYGLDKFPQDGAVLITLINREYSKMLVIMFPGQAYPPHKHILKDETYHILYGDLRLEIEGEILNLKKGDLISVSRQQKHSFQTKNGVIIEEIATTYIKGDSLYSDQSINHNKNRKTSVTIWPD